MKLLIIYIDQKKKSQEFYQQKSLMSKMSSTSKNIQLDKSITNNYKERKNTLKIINDRSLIQKLSIIGLIINFLFREFWLKYFENALIIYWTIMLFFIAGLLLFPKKKE